ncbi:hypothetical protein E5163_04440 [Marinicauda algicola]|uniref:Protein ImuA n=1 Tax=Marinicauda algicola TaxID=2029849 RepID=A0A4S2H416_9PROT|nr:hypothetical protein [Marinicauda algicola]TGY90375.1 hypothetical protein E5163_04440 [Marinicauda algicola]
MGRSDGRRAVAGKADLDALRKAIGALEATGSRFAPPARLRAPEREEAACRQLWRQRGAGEADDPLARFRARPGLHEVKPAAYLDGPLAFVFAALWLAGLGGDRPILWVRGAGDPRLDFGGPCPDGLAARGIDPARLVAVAPGKPADALWAMEEGVKAGAHVLGEAGANPACDLTATKRLHQAALSRGGTLVLLRAHDVCGTSAALTRWSVAPVPSAPAGWKGAGGLPAPGDLRLRAVLERQRGGAPEEFELDFIHDPFRRAQPVSLADRPAPLQRRREAG